MRKLRVFLLALLLFSGLAFGLEVQFFHDVSGGTPLENILQKSASWQKTLSDKIFYPPNEGILWQRVEPSDQGWDSLEIQYSSLDEVLLYFIKDEKIIGQKKAGLNHPFQSRDVGSIYPTFKLDDEKSYDFLLLSRAFALSAKANLS